MKILIVLCLLIIFISCTSFKRDCNKGNMIACYKVGLKYENSEKYQESAKYYKKACNGKYYQACLNLAKIMQEPLKKVFFENNPGATYSSDHYKYYELACNNKIWDACAHLANSPMYGPLGKSKKGDSIAKKGCNGGSELSCSVYAQSLYYQGKHDLAKNILARTCKNNIAGSCLFLSYYHKGEKKRKLIKKACSLGYKFACTPF